MPPKKAAPRRAVVVGGARTPVTKAFGQLMELDTVALGAAAVKGVLDRTGLPWEALDRIVWGGVLLPSGAPNVGREIAIDLGLPPSVEAYTVSRACASGLQAVTDAVAAIERGEVDVVIAGGSDSTSNVRTNRPDRFPATGTSVSPAARCCRIGMARWRTGSGTGRFPPAGRFACPVSSRRVPAS